MPSPVEKFEARFRAFRAVGRCEEGRAEGDLQATETISLRNDGRGCVCGFGDAERARAIITDIFKAALEDTFRKSPVEREGTRAPSGICRLRNLYHLDFLKLIRANMGRDREHKTEPFPFS